jgi:hypothetical protein
MDGVPVTSPPSAFMLYGHDRAPAIVQVEQLWSDKQVSLGLVATNTMRGLCCMRRATQKEQ